METQFIQYRELLKREHDLNRLKEQGVKFIYKRNWLKVGCGVACLVVAVIPNGTGLFLYPLAFYLLNINKVDLFRHKENTLRFFKYSFLKRVLYSCKGVLKNG